MKITPSQNGGPLPYDKAKCPNTITSPLDVLFGERLEEKLQEMYQDGYAAWN